MLNRDVDQPYKYVGIWLVDEWSKIGVKVTQRVVPTGPWFEAERTGNFAVDLQANCHSVVNPLIDVQPYLPTSVSEQNYGNYEDPEEMDLYNKMLHETDPAETARGDVPVRQARDGYPGSQAYDGVVVPDRAIPILRQRLEDQPEPLHQPGSGDDLAR